MHGYKELFDSKTIVFGQKSFEKKVEKVNIKSLTNTRGRPKVEILLSAVTESRPKVTYHIRPKQYVPPKVKRDFRPKTETESQSYLS